MKTYKGYNETVSEIQNCVARRKVVKSFPLYKFRYFWYGPKYLTLPRPELTRQKAQLYEISRTMPNSLQL